MERGQTNKTWVFGKDRFNQRIQDQLGIRDEPKAKGGDRKSELFNSNGPFLWARLHHPDCPIRVENHKKHEISNGCFCVADIFS